jgi:hypothetical protein
MPLQGGDLTNPCLVPLHQTIRPIQIDLVVQKQNSFDSPQSETCIGFV